MTGFELVASWLTPTVLFCILNLMIGTIFFTSSRKQQNLGDNSGGHPPQLGRVPSFLERVKSLNLSRQQPDPAHSAAPAQEQADGDHPPPLCRVPSILERVKSINLSRKVPDPGHYAVPAQEQLADCHQDNGEPHHVTRSKSEALTNITVAATRGLKKSASEKVSVEKEVSVDERRPATVRERTVAVEDEAVDAKADDFINRFRQQLKLQRIDSILRRKEMVN